MSETSYGSSARVAFNQTLTDMLNLVKETQKKCLETSFELLKLKAEETKRLISNINETNQALHWLFFRIKRNFSLWSLRFSEVVANEPSSADFDTDRFWEVFKEGMEINRMLKNWIQLQESNLIMECKLLSFIFSYLVLSKC